MLLFSLFVDFMTIVIKYLRYGIMQAFMQTWVAACHSGGPAKVVFPVGTFLTGPLVYAGPCDGPMTVEIQGTVKATTDISEYSSAEWILFESITGLSLIGSGTFDGQGAETWMYNDCRKHPHCTLPPTVSIHSISIHPLNFVC